MSEKCLEVSNAVHHRVAAYSSLETDSVNGEYLVIQDLPLNQVQTRSSLNHMANLAGFQLESSLLKLLLHISSAKET